MSRIFIDEFDNELLESLVSSYKIVDEEIKSLGEVEVRKYVPLLLIRKECIRNYIVNYVQNFINGLVSSAPYLEVQDIDNYVRNYKPRHNK